MNEIAMKTGANSVVTCGCTVVCDQRSSSSFDSTNSHKLNTVCMDDQKT